MTFYIYRKIITFRDRFNLADQALKQKSMRLDSHREMGKVNSGLVSHFLRTCNRFADSCIRAL